MKLVGPAYQGAAYRKDMERAGTLVRSGHFHRSNRSEIDEVKLNRASGVAERVLIAHTGSDRSNHIAASRDRNAAGQDASRAIFFAEREPAGHAKPDHGRNQPRPDHQENE